MNRMFYPKLAASNIKKNGKFYFPYILTCIGTVLMFYVMSFIAYNPGIMKMPGGGSLLGMMTFGTITIGIFSVIFLFYTNSFLMKRRKKELGLYNILGMEKRHIGKMLFFESLYIAVIGLAGGLLCGVLFSKLILLILLKMLNFTTPIAFGVSKRGIGMTIALFCVIFSVMLISNQTRVHLANPIELLRGGNVGEKEPRTKGILAVLGFLALGSGYFIAITTKSPIDAIPLFFVAVVLVIIGTYCLFTAGSIVLLKALRKRKNYYYQTKHFTSISGMIYRMKQNAVGLANICILSTMVLVMVSTTVCLYLGVEDALDFRFPADISIQKNYEPNDNASKDLLKQETLTRIKEAGRSIFEIKEQSYLAFSVGREGNRFVFDEHNNTIATSKQHVLVFISASEYQALTGKEASLKKDEVLIFSDPVKLGKTFDLFGTTYTVKGELTQAPIESDYKALLVNSHFIVVADDEVLEHIYQGEIEVYKEKASNMEYQLNIDINGTDEQIIACYHKVEDLGDYTSSRAATRKDFYTIYGGFLFLGIFLGTLFLMATVLIIYYKQVSEGYDDKERFEIMQKVGMSKEEVKNSIGSQVLTVFFLPIVAAGIHVVAAFPMITRLLVLFNLTNTSLFIYCTLGTVILFAFIYAVVYLVTARVYYKIVK